MFKLRLQHFLVTSILFHQLKFFVEDFEPMLKSNFRISLVKIYAPQKYIKLPIEIHQSRMTSSKGVDLCGLSSGRGRQFYIFLRGVGL